MHKISSNSNEYIICSRNLIIILGTTTLLVVNFKLHVQVQVHEHEYSCLEPTFDSDTTIVEGCVCQVLFTSEWIVFSLV